MNKAQQILDLNGHKLTEVDRFKLSIIAYNNVITLKHLEFIDFIVKKYHLNDGIKESNVRPNKENSVYVKGIPKHYKQKWKKV